MQPSRLSPWIPATMKEEGAGEGEGAMGRDLVFFLGPEPRHPQNQ